MREDCRHFQSRTYDTGEVARFCVLDLAPEAPWRCPSDCASYALRVDDAGWVRGSLVDAPVEAEPDEPGVDVGGLLHEATDIVNTVAAETLGEVEAAEDADAREHPQGRQASMAEDAGDLGAGHGQMRPRRWPWRRAK